jgi:hypothetical protein
VFGLLRAQGGEAVRVCGVVLTLTGIIGGNIGNGMWLGRGSGVCAPGSLRGKKRERGSSWAWGVVLTPRGFLARRVGTMVVGVVWVFRSGIYTHGVPGMKDRIWGCGWGVGSGTGFQEGRTGRGGGEVVWSWLGLGARCLHSWESKKGGWGGVEVVRARGAVLALPGAQLGEKRWRVGSWGLGRGLDTHRGPRMKDRLWGSSWGLGSGVLAPGSPRGMKSWRGSGFA